jgi:hypothetical protein
VMAALVAVAGVKDQQSPSLAPSGIQSSVLLFRARLNARYTDGGAPSSPPARKSHASARPAPQADDTCTSRSSREAPASTHSARSARAVTQDTATSTANAFKRGRECRCHGTASCRIEVSDVDALFAELQSAGVLHDVSRAGVAATDFGTREFAMLDRGGNLITFFRWNYGCTS